MTPTDSHLIEVAKRYVAIGVQISQAYNAEQAKLSLDKVLSYERLSSPEGTQESLVAIERLAALTDSHAAAMEKIFVSVTGDLSGALAALTERQQAEYRAGILKTLHGQLTAQSQFYANRKRWIEAAREICKLVETERENASFEREQIVFSEEADHVHFESLLESIEEIHTAEVIHMKQLLDRFSEAATLLGLKRA